MRQILRILFLLLPLALSFFPSLMAQDLGNIKNTKPVSFTGGMSLRLNGYSSNREFYTRDPFLWTISGTPTLSVYGLHLPFSFAFSKNSSDFGQPFNQFGVSPYYKWLKLHLGHRSLSFSEYTLANHMFLGAGFEATPSIFRLGFVYGRFLKAVEQPLDTLGQMPVLPTYTRRGFAAKVGIGTHSNYVDLIMFKGKDDSTSIGESASGSIAAAENLVYGLKSHQAFLRIFDFDLDVGVSAYTYDIQAPEIEIARYNVPKLVTGLLKPNISTLFTMAGKASLSMRLKLFQLRLQYMRVEPDYQSMGSYFLNNDLENITIGPSWSMFKNKLRFTGSIGFQRNNLFEDKESNSSRRIHSLNISFTPNARYGFNAFYTNYRINQERNIRTTFDTLKLEQFSNNANISTFLNLGNKVRRHAFNVGVNYQELKDENNFTTINSNTSSISPSLSYRFNNVPAKFGINSNININKFETASHTTLRWGYSLGASKSLMDKKLTLNANATYYNNKVNGINHSNAFAFTGRGNYSISKRHSLNISGNIITRSAAGGAVTEEVKAIRDILWNLGYNFNL